MRALPVPTDAEGSSQEATGPAPGPREGLSEELCGRVAAEGSPVWGPLH